MFKNGEVTFQSAISQTRILIVEDEPVIALDIEECLMTLGYEVVAVADCAAAVLETVSQSQPNLVLMDIHLRGEQNGIETAARLRQEYNLPIVFLTAHADEATLAQAKATQPFGYIVKPFQMRDLSVAIEIALSRYQAEVSMQRALEKEKELNELKSRFVAIVSHEFRNPLSSVLLSLDLLEHCNRKAPVEKQQVYFNRARTAVEQMIQLLEDVLIVTELDTKRFTCQLAPLMVIDFCEELIEQFLLHPEISHTICFTAIGFNAVDSLYLLDEKLLCHILTNLLSNAIKYSPAQSTIQFDLICDNNTLTFRIQDQGIGISVSDQSHLFDSFYRGENVGNIPGSGLGLSIVKQCVEVHQGQITVESQLGVGTTFTVTLNQQLVE